MNEIKMKLRVGGFVAASLLLLLVMLFFFGLSGIFAERTKIYTTFSESIQGLNVGADVTYRGTKIGSVSAISISVSQHLTRVEMELDLDSFVEGDEGKGEMKLSRFERIFGEELKKGLCCRLAMAGITGLKVIELDYEPASDYLSTSKRGVWQDREDLFYLPSIPFPLKDLMAALTNSLERISRVHFEEISDEMETSLAHLSALLSNPALLATLERFNTISTNLDENIRTFSEVMDGKRMETLISSLENTLKSAENLLRDFDTAMEGMKLKESAASLREAAEAVRVFQGESSGTLTQLNATLETVRQLCDQLNRNPGMLFGAGRLPAGTPGRK